MLIPILIAIALLLLLGVRVIAETDRGVADLFGRKRVVGPGVVWVIPVVERLTRISMEPFSVSLPPQSVITKDEVPIQLQASVDAHITDPCVAAGVRDWRISLISDLQSILKDRIEDLDFDNMDRVFADWVNSIRVSMTEKAKQIGAEITTLNVSNLSPRTRP